MTLDDIIKALEAKDVEGATISAIKALDNGAEVERLNGELKASEGKAAGILADKKAAQAERDTYKAKADEFENSKLSTEEKIQKQIDELQKAKEEAESRYEQQGKSFAEKERENAILKIAGSVKWASGIPSDTASLIIKNAMAAVEDLSDSKKVDEVLNTIKDSHKAFIAAEVPAGSGGRQGSQDVKDDSKDSTIGDAVESAWAK